MSTTTLCTLEDVEDLLRGLTLMGTGGGGRFEVGRGLLEPHVRAGRPLRWVDLAELPAGGWSASVFSMGSIAPTPVLSAEARARLGYGELRYERPMVEAVRMLERFTGRPVAALVPFELGAGNTAGPLDVATELGIPLVDADYAGRAIPELAQTLAAIHGVPFWPGAIVDSWGNRLLVEEAPSLAMAERVGKTLSIVTRRPDPTLTCAHAGFYVPVGELAGMVVPGTVSRAFATGRAIRQATEAGRDPVAAAAEAIGGWVLFTGRVTAKTWESRDGYMVGDTVIDGDGASAGGRLRLWFKNENHLAWRDNEVVATSPDLIMVLGQAGEPLTNTVMAEGQAVGVVVAPAHPRLREPAARVLLEPAHYGFDVPYVPVERLAGRRTPPA